MPVRVRLRARPPDDVPTGLSPPEFLPPVAGIRLASVRAIKSKRRDDLTAVEIEPGSSVAGVFTQNRYPAPPVTVCREHLQDGGGRNIRGLLINAGIANAGTLGRGLKDARKTCRLLADALRCSPRDILPFSTGVIMEHLPMDRYAEGLARCAGRMREDGWLDAARAIMTTDTVAKGAYRTVRAGGKNYVVTGIAKGSGMIHPNMATMLAFVATDAAVPPARLAAWQRAAAKDSFNAITVDGDTSTNDSFLLIATGQAGRPTGQAAEAVRLAIAEVCAELAEAIVRDGEGATKLVRITARGAQSAAACRRVAEAIARSPLVKTAIAASDANVGRLLMAAGNGGDGFDPGKLQMNVGGLPVIGGGGLHPRYDEAAVSAVLAGDEIDIDIRLGASPHQAAMLTCDLTARYIEINAAYRS